MIGSAQAITSHHSIDAVAEMMVVLTISLLTSIGCDVGISIACGISMLSDMLLSREIQNECTI